MAVDESHRGEGVGTALLQAAHQAAAPEAIWCNARLTAAPFYTRHGWQTISDVFAISHVGPHVRMLHGGR
jgi:GNAT superfamily N-acetyltransferase